MAIVEISRIQIRRGQQNITGEPTLSPGEFGWAQDTENLWIGKRVSEGAPDDNNTRILTENDFTALIALTTASGNSVYQYEGIVPGTSGPFLNTIQRTIKTKLDDVVSFLDFYSISTSTSAHASLQNAVYALYQSTVSTSTNAPFARQVLRIPAGYYNFDQTVLIPPYATIVGDGAGKTILISTTGTSIFQFCDANSNIIENLGTFNSSDRPQKILVDSISFQYSSTLTNLNQNFAPLFRADAAEDSLISNCEFKGVYTIGTSTNNAYAGIEIRSEGAIVSQDLIIDNCTFDSVATGVLSSYDTADTSIVNSRFKTLNRGIAYSITTSTVTPNVTGPVRTRATNNRFENILQEAFLVDNAYGTNILTNHVSAFNTFRDIGLTSTGTFTTAVINYKTLGNVSTGDYFDRLDDVRANRNSYFSTSSWMVAGSSYIDNEQVYKSSLVAASTTTFTVLPFSYPTTRARVDYNISMSNFAREGYFIVNASNITSGATALVTDNYSYTGDNPATNNLGVVFSASLNTVNQVIELIYTSESSVSGNITYKYSLLQ